MSQDIQFTYKDHILICDNHLTKDECQYLINYFDRQEEGGFTGISQVDKNNRLDYQLAVNEPNAIFAYPFSSMYVDKFWEYCYPEYLHHNPCIEIMAPHHVGWLKLQKTMPKGGFHKFHMEAQDRGTSDRILTLMTYLNDVEQGGTTEFIQQGLQVEPKAGRTIVWPAYYTHPHRGNPPYSGAKYIITGWVSFV